VKRIVLCAFPRIPLSKLHFTSLLLHCRGCSLAAHSPERPPPQVTLSQAAAFVLYTLPSPTLVPALRLAVALTSQLLILRALAADTYLSWCSYACWNLAAFAWTCSLR